MKTFIFIAGLLFISLTAVAQKDIGSDKYIFNGIYINPAYTGYKQDFYVQSFYKSQWTGFTGAPQSFSLAGDAQISNSKVGLGLVISSDNIGAQSYLSAYGNYAYRIQVGDNENTQMAFGLGLGFVQNGIDGTKLLAVDNGDNIVPSDFQSVLLPDSRVGAMYSCDDFYIGVSMDNMIAHYFKHDNTIFDIVPKPQYYLTAGTLMTLNDDIKLKPSFLIRDEQDGIKNMDLNAFVLFGDRLWLGATYRTDIVKTAAANNIQSSNSVAAVMEIVVNEKIRVGYSFNYSMSPLGNNNYGSHEISLGIYLKSKKTTSYLNSRYF